MRHATRRPRCGLLHNRLGNFPQSSTAYTRAHASRALLVASGTLHRGRGLRVGAALQDLVVTLGAVAVEGLLVRQINDRRARLVLDLRNLCERLRLLASARVAVAAGDD